MKGPAKLSVKLNVLVTYEMSVWLDEVARETDQTKSAAARALLQTLMDEDKQAEERAA